MHTSICSRIKNLEDELNYVRTAVGVTCMLGLLGLLGACQAAPEAAPVDDPAMQSAADTPAETASDAIADTDPAADAGAATSGDNSAQGPVGTATFDVPPPPNPQGAAAYELLSPDRISFEVEALTPGATVTCEPRPEIPLDVSASPATGGIPAHVKCTWDGDEADDLLPPATARRQLLVIPIAPYMAAYAKHGLPPIEQQLALHTMLAIEKPANPGVAVPMLPPATGPGPSIAIHPEYLHITGGTGMRYVTLDGPPPIAATPQDGLFYTYQGLTSDGEHWVALFYPVSAGTVLESSADALADLESDPDAYFAVVSEALASLDPESGFTPSLSVLDGVVGSLAIGSP
jgi:hypothetical protein